ncbi:hypothetical protein [Roseibium sp. M-1]
MSDLTAIDILIEPDNTALDRAAAENTRLRSQFSDGFALDARHKPHITLLQRYVWTAELETVYSTVEKLVRTVSFDRLSFEATAIKHMKVATIPGHGLAAILAKPGAEVLKLQSDLIAAIKPFTGSGGTAAAFATDAEEPDINADTLSYVERYVPDHSGANYLAHITIGLAPLDYLDRIESQPFDGFGFHPEGVGIYHLGNNGTARTKLKSWGGK